MGINDEPMIKQKNYSVEEYKAKKTKSFRVAKRIVVMSEIMHISLVNEFVSLGLFLLLIMGTSAMPFFLDIDLIFSANTFILRGGLFITLCIVFLVLFTISGFWYAIAYKRLEIMCIHLDGGLDGAMEVNEAAQRDIFFNSLERGAVGVSTNFNSISGPDVLAKNYMKQNEVKQYKTKISKRVNIFLILSQLITALVCVVIWIKY